MSLTIARLKHHAKVFVGNQLGRFLQKQYLSGKGPASRFISVFSDKAKRIGVEQKILVNPIPIKKVAPNFSLDGDTEKEYRKRLISGEDYTNSAGIIYARNVDVSFPTGMHQIGNQILKEVMPAPYVQTNPKYYYGLQSIHFKRKRPMDNGVLLSMP